MFLYCSYILNKVMLQEQVNREEIGMNPAQFVSKLQEKGIQLSEKQQKQFTKYYQILVKWNEKMNLTGLTEEQDVYLKHFYDSITLAFYVNFEEVESICDIGSGAGFPRDRKSTRLNSSHVASSYAVFCLKKKRESESKRTR